jgi:hypothetical protein
VEVAESGHSAALLQAITGRERELATIKVALNSNPKPRSTEPAEIRGFVEARLADIRELLTADVPRAKAFLMKHIDEIQMQPTTDADGSRQGPLRPDRHLVAIRKERPRPCAFGWLRGTAMHRTR